MYGNGHSYVAGFKSSPEDRRRQGTAELEGADVRARIAEVAVEVAGRAVQAGIDRGRTHAKPIVATRVADQNRIRTRRTQLTASNQAAYLAGAGRTGKAVDGGEAMAPDQGVDQLQVDARLVGQHDGRSRVVDQRGRIQGHQAAAGGEIVDDDRMILVVGQQQVFQQVAIA